MLQHDLREFAGRTLIFFLVLAFGAIPVSVPLADAQDSPVPIYKVTGSVEDVDGAALDSAAVELVNKSDGSQVQEATTNSEGRYEFSQVAAGDYLVSASHTCCLRGSTSVSIGGTNLTTDAGAIILQFKQEVASGDAVLLSGTVIDKADNGPVAGVRLEIYSYWTSGDEDCKGDVCAVGQSAQYFTAESDSQGRFELDVNRGSANLQAFRDGFDITSGSFSMEDDRVLEVPMRAAAADTARLYGVLQSVDGSPIANGWISVGPDYRTGSCPPNALCAARPGVSYQEPCDGADPCWSFESRQNQWASSQTGSDGAWEVEVGAGRLLVTAYADQYLEDQQSVDVAAGDDREITLQLQPIPADSVKVSGHVRDRDTGDPVVGASVNLENQKWGTYAYATTDESGRYEFMTKPGYSVLSATAYGFFACPEATVAAQEDGASPGSLRPCAAQERDREYYPATLVLVPNEGDELTADFDLKARPRATSEFKGYILNGTQKEPIPSAVVTFYNEETKDWGSATSDGNGSFKIAVHPGYYSVRIWADGFFDGVANLEIGSKESKRVDFELTPGQKRYGRWAYGGYDVAVAHSASPEGRAAAAPEGPPMPTEGQNVYSGEGGGLGPYQPLSSGGKAPGVGVVVLGMTMVAIAVQLRRRSPR